MNDEQMTQPPQWRPWKWDGGDRFSFEGNLIHGARLEHILNSHEQRMKAQKDTINAQQQRIEAALDDVLPPSEAK